MMSWMKSMVGVVLAISLLALGGCETLDENGSRSGSGGHSHSH